MKITSTSSTEKNDHEYGYELAYRLVCEQLAKIDDIEQQCIKSGATYEVTDSRKTAVLEYLNRLYKISLPDIDVSLKDSEEVVPLRDKILILHYFTQAKGTPLSDKIMAYKELPGGDCYLPTFFKRAINPIVNNFGDNPQRLLDVAETLGGHKADHGDVAVTINAFSKVPITFILWQGDDEFPPEANILFDKTIAKILSPEDVAWLAGMLVYRLIKLSYAA